MKEVTSEDQVFCLMHYKRVNNQIVVYHSDGLTDTIPYSFKNELRLLKGIRKQVLVMINSFSEKETTLKKLLVKDSWLTAIGILATAIMSICSLPMSFIIFVAGFTLLAFAITLSTYITLNDLRDNFEKYKLFLQNDTDLNDMIRKQPELTNDLKKSLKKKILPVNQKERAFTLNTINNVSYKELKKVYEAVENNNAKKKVLTNKRYYN